MLALPHPGLLDKHTRTHTLTYVECLLCRLSSLWGAQTPCRCLPSLPARSQPSRTLMSALDVRQPLPVAHRQALCWHTYCDSHLTCLAWRGSVAGDHQAQCGALPAEAQPVHAQSRHRRREGGTQPAAEASLGCRSFCGSFAAAVSFNVRVCCMNLTCRVHVLHCTLW